MVSEVRNIDCMEGMKEFPDKFFDLAIVDPPYGLGDKKLTQGGTWAAKYKTGDASWDIAPNEEYFTELFRISKNQIVWGANYFNKFLPPSRCYIIWDKISHLPTMADCEYAWVSIDSNAKICKVLRSGNQCSEDRIHICQKPVKLYKWLLHNYANPTDKILDTHMGSQSSRIAAYDMGFDYWGFELDLDYFNAGCKRYSNHILQHKIEFEK